MKAVIVKESNSIVFDDIDEGQLGDSDVRINVKYTGICGSDIPRALNNGAHSYPIILGHEFSGVVTEIGRNVKRIKVGAHVVGVPLIPCMKCSDCLNGNYSLCKNYSFVGSRRQGSMAEYIILPEDNVFVIDKDIPLLSAAFFEPSTIAYHAILLNDISNYDNACIIGSGNIGYFVLAWLKILGVKNITVIGRNELKLNRMLKYGATFSINTNDDNWSERIYDITNGNGFDNVFECAGDSETIKLCYKVAANKGKVCFVGTPKNDVIFTVKEWENINRKELTVRGSWMSYSSEFPGIEWIRTNEEFKNGNLVIPEDIIHGIYSMKDCEEAFSQFKKKVLGKVIIKNEFFNDR